MGQYLSEMYSLEMVDGTYRGLIKKKHRMSFADLVDVQWGPKSLKLYGFGVNISEDYRDNGGLR